MDEGAEPPVYLTEQSEWKNTDRNKDRWCKGQSTVVEESRETRVGAWSFLPCLVVCYEDTTVSSNLYVIAGLVPYNVSCLSLVLPLSGKSTSWLDPRMSLVQLSTM